MPLFHKLETKSNNGNQCSSKCMWGQQKQRVTNKKDGLMTDKEIPMWQFGPLLRWCNTKF